MGKHPHICSLQMDSLFGIHCSNVFGYGGHAHRPVVPERTPLGRSDRIQLERTTAKGQWDLLCPLWDHRQSFDQWATIRSVGNQRTWAPVSFIDSCMITISMLVRLSSTAVGDDGGMRSHTRIYLQSVAMTGGRLASMDRHSRISKRPSRASANIKLSHSTVPVAEAMAWLSPPNAELTARGKR